MTSASYLRKLRAFSEAMESTSRSWDEHAPDLDTAKFTVWSVPPDTYDDTTKDCLRLLYPRVPDFPSRMLDLGCGIGRLTIPMARAYPNVDVVGVDISQQMLRLAQRQADTSHVHNARFIRSVDLPDLGPISFAWEIVMFQHTYPENCEMMVEWVAGMLEPGGVFMYQVVENIDFTDWGHLPAEVPRGWAERYGLNIVEELRATIHPDWLWIVAQKPALP